MTECWVKQEKKRGKRITNPSTYYLRVLVLNANVGYLIRKIHLFTFILFQFKSVNWWSSSFTLLIDSSGSVLLGGSGGKAFGCVAFVIPSQPIPTGWPLFNREAWYWSWFIIEWNPKIAVYSKTTNYIFTNGRQFCKLRFRKHYSQNYSEIHNNTNRTRTIDKLTTRYRVHSVIATFTYCSAKNLPKMRYKLKHRINSR